MDDTNYAKYQVEVEKLKIELETLQRQQAYKLIDEQYNLYLNLKQEYASTLKSMNNITTLETGNCLQNLPEDFINVEMNSSRQLKEVIERMQEILERQETVNHLKEFPCVSKDKFSQDIRECAFAADSTKRLFVNSYGLLSNVKNLIKDSKERAGLGKDSLDTKDNINILKANTHKPDNSDNFSDCTVNTFSEESVFASSPI